MTSERNTDILFLQNVLKRIPQLEIVGDEYVLNSLLYEIYNFTEKCWSIELHSIFIKIVEISINRYRDLLNDLDYYYNIAHKNDNINAFIEICDIIKPENDKYTIPNLYDHNKRLNYLCQTYTYILNIITTSDVNYQCFHKVISLCYNIDNLNFFIKVYNINHKYINKENFDILNSIKEIKLTFKFKDNDRLYRSVQYLHNNNYETHIEYIELMINISSILRDFKLMTLFYLEKYDKTMKIEYLLEAAVSSICIIPILPNSFISDIFPNTTITLSAHPDKQRIHQTIIRCMESGIQPIDLNWFATQGYIEYVPYIHRKLCFEWLESTSLPFMLPTTQISIIGIENITQLIEFIKQFNYFSIQIDHKEGNITFSRKPIQHNECYSTYLRQREWICNIKDEIQNNNISLIHYENIISPTIKAATLKLIEEERLKNLTEIQNKKIEHIQYEENNIKNNQIKDSIKNRLKCTHSGSFSSLDKSETEDDIKDNAKLLIQLELKRNKDIKLKEWQTFHTSAQIIRHLELESIAKEPLQDIDINLINQNKRKFEYNQWIENKSHKDFILSMKDEIDNKLNVL